MFRFSKHSRNSELQVTRVFLEAGFQKKEIESPSGVRIEMRPCVNDLSSKEVEQTLPLAEDYTLQALLSAGLPLREVSTVGLQSDSALSEKLKELDASFADVESKSFEL